ncbi:DNA polymerase (family 10) [Anseongella ginsenosidimutans]|uniref:DNA polymerase (Family 10) n=1 Tax=Anseongella ginsenosidimutans TaxID=496056 RepID=A0A4R3KP06_9SPHI|nr:helix-hairpin-helix domain-containing protein [Anseongella ginsenosidimutans]QEC53712.1 DNA polymerase/3'-5' exonuclease PolX [Anseongella ginsenosidimutans]TCS86037.1 DNA polymerase (family 10) [Anseongella ginsenosidimutans]
MENKIIARTLRLLSQLMELHDVNPFKVRSMSNAARKIDKFPQTISSLNPDELEKIEGIGKSTAGKVVELIETGKISELEDLRAETPEGIIELLSIKGLGPKKLQILWKQLGIDNAGELYYACNENRLVEAKGFGIKTQEEIKKLLEFTMNNQGKFHYSAAAAFGLELENWLCGQAALKQLSPTGEFRRRSEVLTCVEFLVSAAGGETLLAERLFTSGLFRETPPGLDGQTWTGYSLSGMKVCIHFVPEEEFPYRLLCSTGSNVHLEQLRQVNSLENYRTAASEQEIYQGLGLNYIVPELREGLQEVSWSASRQLPRLVEYEDLKGCLHNHTTYSDGIHTLEEMALQCIQNGYDYLGVCDHSRSAFYAGGLSEERVKQQQTEIDLLNSKLAPFRIFKGIESDILYDGSLDYNDEILASFDFVVASVHSQLKMTEEKATSRLISAIENPYTTILGHPTGRLLLGRQGYYIDHEKVIDACAANQVVIELNSNPLRLDLDWRWIQYALQKQVMIAINPDAHRKEGLKDMQYGVLAARKGGLPKSACFNALTLEQAATWFKLKREKAIK